MASSEFSGRTALVTGAASGIGAACANWLATRGIGRLILVDLDGDRLATINAACSIEPHAGTVTDEALWERIEAKSGAIDYAVLNAGISTAAPIADLDFAEWRRTLDVNLDGLLLSMRFAMRRIRDDGSIVVTASATELKAEPGTAAYGTSKAAAIHLAKVAAKEGAARESRQRHRPRRRRYADLGQHGFLPRACGRTR